MASLPCQFCGKEAGFFSARNQMFRCPNCGTVLCDQCTAMTRAFSIWRTAASVVCIILAIPTVGVSLVGLVLFGFRSAACHWLCQCCPDTGFAEASGTHSGRCSPGRQAARNDLTLVPDWHFASLVTLKLCGCTGIRCGWLGRLCGWFAVRCGWLGVRSGWLELLCGRAGVRCGWMRGRYGWMGVLRG
jgi:hypothetical protein